MGPPTASQPCDANFVISRCKGSYRAYLQGPPLEKRAQPSAGGESRIDLSFLDLNCTGARDTDCGHPSPPISPKRGRLRLSPSAEVLCNELTPRAHGSIHLLDSSSTPFADQRGQCSDGHKRACLGPKGDYEDHVVTTLPSPIWHTDTEERRPLKGCSSTGKGLAWHVWSPVLSPQHDRNLVWWHTLISPALGRWEGQREARGAEVLLGYTVSPGATRAT